MIGNRHSDPLQTLYLLKSGRLFLDSVVSGGQSLRNVPFPQLSHGGDCPQLACPGLRWHRAKIACTGLNWRRTA